MNKLLILILITVSFAFISGCQSMHHHKRECGNCQQGMSQNKPCCLKSSANMMNGAEKGGVRADELYACNCGNGCNCNTLSKQPGNCSCGKPLRWHHVVKVEGDVAVLCGCAEGCKCSLDPNDPEKCGCGKPVRKVDLKGSDLFFCNCGGSCTCNNISSTAGQCRCGMPLKQAN